MTEPAPSAEVLPAAVADYILAFADDEHLMGQRHTEWIGVAPFLEEDLAFASIGQDELGHAAALYAVLAGDDDRSIDELAFGRAPEDHRSCWLVEYETDDWAETLVRHWFYDAAERLRWGLLAGSALGPLADLVDRAEREERFHRRHADGLLDTLLTSDDARARIEAAARTIWPLAVGLFDGVRGEAELVADGVLVAPWSAQQPVWRELVDARFPGVDFDAVPAEACTPAQVNRTVRSDDFGVVYDRIREVLTIDTEAVW